MYPTDTLPLYAAGHGIHLSAGPEVTRIGVDQVAPLSEDVDAKTLVWVIGSAVSWTPSRLSAQAIYRFPVTGSAVIPCADMVRNWCPVCVATPSALIG